MTSFVGLLNPPNATPKQRNTNRSSICGCASLFLIDPVVTSLVEAPQISPNHRDHPPATAKEGPRCCRPRSARPRSVEPRSRLEIDRHRPPSNLAVSKPSFVAGNHEQRLGPRQSQGCSGADPGSCSPAQAAKGPAGKQRPSACRAGRAAVGWRTGEGGALAGIRPVRCCRSFESAGPHHEPAPFLVRISADIAHKGGRRSRSEITEKHLVSRVGSQCPPLAPSRVPPPPGPFGAVCVELLPCFVCRPHSFHPPVPIFWDVAHPLARPSLASTRGAKNRSARPP